MTRPNRKSMPTGTQDSAERRHSAYFGLRRNGLGAIFSLGTGFELMALLFNSSRKGFDDPPVLIVPNDDFERPEETAKDT